MAKHPLIEAIDQSLDQGVSIAALRKQASQRLAHRPDLLAAAHHYLLAVEVARATPPAVDRSALPGWIFALWNGGMEIPQIASWLDTRLNRSDRLYAHHLLGQLAQQVGAPPALPPAQSLANGGAIALPEPQTAPPKLFDWGDLAPNGDQFRHVAIVGEPSTGKTTLAAWLCRLQTGKAHRKALTTRAKSGQWAGFEVIGKGRDFAALDRAYDHAVAAMTARLGDVDNVAEKGFLHLALDEIPAQSANVPNFRQRVGNLVREGREALIRLWILTQTDEVGPLGLEGEGGTKKAFIWVRLGEFATQHAKRLYTKKFLSDEEFTWLSQQQRPCMVGDKIAEIPNLATEAVDEVTASPAEVVDAAEVVDEVVDEVTAIPCGSGDPAIGAITEALSPEVLRSLPEAAKIDLARCWIKSGISKTSAIKLVWGFDGGDKFVAINQKL